MQTYIVIAGIICFAVMAGYVLIETFCKPKSR